MKWLVGVCCAVLLCTIGAGGETLKTYNAARATLIAEEQAMNATSQSGERLTVAEQKVATWLYARQSEYLNETVLAKPFPPSNPWYGEKAAIEAHPLFEVLRQMPKGAILHTHLPAASSYDWYVCNATYRDDCYAFVASDTASGPSKMKMATRRSMYKSSRKQRSFSFKEKSAPVNGAISFFPPSVPPPILSNGKWEHMNTLRKEASSAAAFDKALLKQLSMEGKPMGTYDETWASFQGIFASIDVAFEPVFRGFMQNVFVETIKDNVQHLESRSSPYLSLYDAHGNEYPSSYTMNVIEDVLAVVQQDYPEANFTFRIIGAPLRDISKEDMTWALQTTVDNIEKFPKLVCGFDIDGPEDSGYSLHHYVPEFLAALEDAQSRRPPVSLRWFFHAGETNLPWNQNLYDAYLLNATRIGHGFALEEHPLLLELYAEKPIPVEICPVSNQVLQVVANLQNHSGLKYLRRNVPITIASDDPGIWGYSGVTPDFWEVFMAWELGLAQLKLLAHDSLEYSCWFNEEEKKEALSHWNDEWHRFISKLANEI